MVSPDVLSQTLSSITTVKLSQLEKQKSSYEAKKKAVFDARLVETDDTAKRMKNLVDSTEKILASDAEEKKEFRDLRRLVAQSKYDPSVSDTLLKQVEEGLVERLEAGSNKFAFASLYGKLVKEWITPAVEKKEGEETEEAVIVGREEMHVQRQTWEGYAFTAKETDGKATKSYLEAVFASSKEAEQGWDAVRKSLKETQKAWEDKNQWFNPDRLDQCIRGMLRSDILTEGKKKTLRDFQGSELVLQEIADVLNVRVANLGSWSWDATHVVEQRRNLNGRYRFYTDEDLLDSIFVYYIGMRWAVRLKEVLNTFATKEGVWKPDVKPISKEDARRREFFLRRKEVLHPPHSMHRLREEHFRETILLDQLPDSTDEVRGNYGDDGKVQEEDTRKSPTAVVQNLLQRVLAEIQIQTSLGNEVTVIRSDFKWFGPSLPHSSIFAVLEFLGVNEHWRGFFKKVLQAPVRFKEDSSAIPDQIRQRGIPIGSPISDFFGEALLFCLDFAVNQKADGTRLYRLHDDIWLWGGLQPCVQAWEVIEEFTSVFGLEINQEKTGSARVVPSGGGKSDERLVKGLPTGDVVWGFLRLDSATGKFVIRQDEVDKHIEELRLQLNSCRSVLDFVQAWNIYGSRFFLSNFGRPSNSYGRAHIDNALATFQRIQKKLFPEQSGGVGEHLKHLISSRFAIAPADIPDGFLYLPTELSGLGLQNPFVSLLVMRHDDEAEEKLQKLMEKFFLQEQVDYNLAKTDFENHHGSPAAGGATAYSSSSGFADLRDEPFMSFTEFTRYRERTSGALHGVYQELMRETAAPCVQFSQEVTAALDNIGRSSSRRELSLEDQYLRWILQVYHRETIARFGGLRIVDEGLLPTGLMEMLKTSRFRWMV